MAPVFCLYDPLKQLVSYLIGDTLKSVVRVHSPLTFPWCHYHHHHIITIISFLHEAQWVMGAWVVLTVQWQRLYLLVLVSVASTQVQVLHKNISEWTYNLMHIINATFQPSFSCWVSWITGLQTDSACIAQTLCMWASAGAVPATVTQLPLNQLRILFWMPTKSRFGSKAVTSNSSLAAAQETKFCSLPGSWVWPWD